ncbi:SDR family oxidoreductase [Neptunicella sp.]|uniref:SDR family oxidoreductase n=1 Tax=Neptunicella sp. TaxID=2125986 RepID=UPI003F68C589
MKIDNKTIWLTGASSGIGEELARQLADQGALLILSARNAEKLQQLKNELTNSQQHSIVPLDLSRPETVAALVDQQLAAGLQVDMLINNAGLSQRGSARDTLLHVQRNVMEVNYFGTIALTQALLPTLLNQQGMIVTIASVAGKVGGKGMSGYSASKHAIIGYMDCLRAEESPNGLKVLTVCPGFVQTNISVNALAENGQAVGQMVDSIKNGIPVQRCAEKIIHAIVADKNEIVIGTGISRLAPVIKRFSPNLLFKLAAAKNVR